MKKYICIVLLGVALLLPGCKEDAPSDAIRIAVSAEYPPFEYHEDNELKGFDIDLARMIAKEIGKKVVFQNVQFSNIFLVLDNGGADIGISAITMSPERIKNFDFSKTYYTDSMSIVFPKSLPIENESELRGKKIACQIGSTMEMWLKRHVPDVQITAMDNNNQVIEALKAGHVDGVFVDSAQSVAFSKKNPDLFYKQIAKADNGYGVAFKKGSSLKELINKALEALESKGEIKKLEKKWGLVE